LPMYGRLATVFCAHFAVLLLWPPAAGAQTGIGVVGTTVPDAASVQPSDELPKDATFLALLKARDDTLALLGELKRITAYHDKLRNGLGILFASVPPSPREARLKIIDAEIERLKKFEDDINGSKDDVKTLIDLASKFDSEFPVSFSSDKSGINRMLIRSLGLSPKFA
jgi:hypothetical protein